MRRALLWMALTTSAGPACSSDEPTVHERRAYTDDAGRSCEATLHKTSSDARSISQSISCDGGAKQCSSNASPCFVLSVDAETLELRSCPACCKGASSSFVGSECSTVVCQTDADCVYAKAACDAGVCSCPGDSCE